MTYPKIWKRSISDSASNSSKETIPGIWTCVTFSVDALPEPLRSRAISEGLPKRRNRGNGTP